MTIIPQNTVTILLSSVYNRPDHPIYKGHGAPLQIDRISYDNDDAYCNKKKIAQFQEYLI